jgi:hypothetical protein
MEEPTAMAIIDSNAPWPVRLRRGEASRYLYEVHGIPVQPATLAKWFCTRSDGPPAHLVGRFPLYPRDGLDNWAARRLGELRTSTSKVMKAERAGLANDTTRPNRPRARREDGKVGKLADKEPRRWLSAKRSSASTGAMPSRDHAAPRSFVFEQHPRNGDDNAPQYWW